MSSKSAILLTPRARLARPSLARGNLARQYSLASLLVLLVSLLILGWWVCEQIQAGVVHRTAAATSLYVENFIVTQLQDLDHEQQLSPVRTAAIERLLAGTPLGREIVAIKVWGRGGRVVYGEHAGKVFPVKDEQADAWRGAVVADISHLSDPENADLRARFPRLLEIYTPIRLEGSDRVLAVAEFYQRVDALDREVRAAQLRSWGVVTLVIGLAYLLLSGLVRRGSDTIDRQRAELRAHVARLEELLAQNGELSARVRRAARRTVAMNERFLRRVASDLHDGPAQDVGVALLRLEQLGRLAQEANPAVGERARAELAALEHSLTSALTEMRTLARDLRLPDVDHLGTAEVVRRAAREHARRTNTPVEVDIAGTLEACPAQVPVSVKMAAFRIVQEALNNAFRHAGGAGQRVSASIEGEELVLDIADAGPGLRMAPGYDGLGLSGMRERAESLGGSFSVGTRPGGGTQVLARLPLAPEAGGE